MRSRANPILITLLLIISYFAQAQTTSIRLSYEFSDRDFNMVVDSAIMVAEPDTLSAEYINNAFTSLEAQSEAFRTILTTIQQFKDDNKLNDWLYYQLVRRTAQAISPKKECYERYTFYKWYMMVKSGYDARLTITNSRLIFYVYSQEDISDIPFTIQNGKKYICLNHHDYDYADLNKFPALRMISRPDVSGSFSYKVTRLPEFRSEGYKEKELRFNYKHKTYKFNVKLNGDVLDLFNNYPVVDFESYFNIPLSRETHGSLIPLLKKAVGKMKRVAGVNYLMHFTRYAFLYEDDGSNFGRERRLSPEETLFSEYSDCDDRAALFFYLVKEIYNLPMIVMLYPTHITMAVGFDTPIGDPVLYKGKAYSICEPTPQMEDLKIGELPSNLTELPYQVVYAYEPIK